jgi:hypothetical protein
VSVRRRVALFGCLALAACGQSGPSSNSGLQDLPALTLHTYEPSPVAGLFGSTADDLAFLQSAISVLVQRCMNAKGFAFDVPPVSPAILDFAPLSIDRATDVGYGQPATALTPVTATVDQSSFAGMSPSNRSAYSAALDGLDTDLIFFDTEHAGRIGVPGTGCRHDAESSIVGDQQDMRSRIEYAAQLSGLVNVAHQKAEETEVWEGVESDWSACIKAAGYGEDMTIERMFETYSAVQLENQRKPAIADAACRERFLVDETRAALYAQSERAALEQSPALVDGYRAMIRTMMQSARALLA